MHCRRLADEGSWIAEELVKDPLRCDSHGLVATGERIDSASREMRDDNEKGHERRGRAETEDRQAGHPVATPRRVPEAGAADRSGYLLARGVGEKREQSEQRKPILVEEPDR